MGLIKAATSALGGTLADSWKEAIHCPRMDNTVIMRKGSRMNAGAGSNSKGNDNVISRGSVINVEEMTCMLTVDNGKITNIVTEPGQYEFDNSTAPCIFAGDIAASLKDALTRFTFGGAASTQQRVVYINLQRLPEIPFGTGTPFPYYDPVYNTSIDLRFHGTFEIQIPDAEMAVRFYREVGSKGVDAGDITVSVFKSEQYKREFMDVLEIAINYLADEGVPYSQIARSKKSLVEKAQEATREKWMSRGFVLTSLVMGPVTLTDESKALLGDRLKADTMLGGDVQRAMMAGSVARGIEAAGSNSGGAMVGLMGMNMAQQTGGNILGQMGPAPATWPKQTPPQAAPAMPQGFGTWKCSCGADNTGKFCAQCGAAKPAAAGEWTCSCGAKNTGKFCAECGAAKPAPAGEWLCSCGAKNTGKFCAECGKAKS